MTRCLHGTPVERCPECWARQQLDALTTTAGHLAAVLMPGTARPWRAPTVSAERRAELDRQAHEDRLLIAQQGWLPAHLRGLTVLVPPGESPAPYDLDTADLLSEILAAADLMADHASLALGLPLPFSASSAFADPRPFLEHTAALLSRLPVEHQQTIASVCADLVETARVSLGEVLDGQVLDAICPWCDGRTNAHPAGGARTLRFRLVEDRGEPFPLIVCEGGHCEPGANSGHRWRGLPAWSLFNEGTWLADCIAARDGAELCACGQPILRTGKAGRPARHCSEECQRAANTERMRLTRAS